jgi:hypothetical protein
MEVKRDMIPKAGLTALVLILWGHGLFLAGRDPWASAVPAHGRLWERVVGGLAELGIGADLATQLLGGAAGAVALVSLAALAAGTEGLRIGVLLAPFLTALSPTFAGAALGSGEEVLFAALLLAGSYRAFAETHTSGRLPVSAVLFGGSAALGLGGLIALAAAFAQKIVFARRFRLARNVYLFAAIWLVVGLATSGLLLIVIDGWGVGPVSGKPILEDGERLGLPRLLAALWRETYGLAWLPYVLVLVLGWKPKALFFLLVQIGLLLAGWLMVAAQAPVAGLRGVLAPAIPLVFLVVGEALRGFSPALEAIGLRGRPRVLLIALVITALGAGQVWPTLVQIANR